MSHKTRIMYIECKGSGIVGPARIGMVTFSKTGQSLYYGGLSFSTLNGYGFKANYVNDGTDALYSTTVEIDEDVREEYWLKIRNKPESKGVKSFRCAGKYSK
jgi:hypothetical protein